MARNPSKRHSCENCHGLGQVYKDPPFGEPVGYRTLDGNYVTCHRCEGTGATYPVILPDPDFISDNDLETLEWPSVNEGLGSTGVVLLHKPTGIAIVCSNNRSKIKNKADALRKLRSVLRQYKPDKSDGE